MKKRKNEGGREGDREEKTSIYCGEGNKNKQKKPKPNRRGILPI